MSKTVQPHILRQYSLIRLLGSGAYGHVWQVLQRATGMRFALKKVFDAFRNSIDAQRTYREVDFLHKLNHQRIVKLHKVFRAKNDQDLYLLFQYMETDLHSVVGSRILSKMHLKYVFFQILSGLKYMHSAQLIHRDLKPSNVLLNSECNIKLCDFGLVRSLIYPQKEQLIMSEEVATKWYRAPQLLLGSNCYGKPVDLWSVGCIVGELLLGKPLFPGTSTINQFQRILQFMPVITKEDIRSLESPSVQTILTQITNFQSKTQRLLSKIDKDFHQLLLGLLEFNPNKRMTIEQALSLCIFEEFRDQKLIVCSLPIIPELNDNERFQIQVYKVRIYEDIEARYNRPEDSQKKKLSLVKLKSQQAFLCRQSRSLERPKGYSSLKKYLYNDRVVNTSLSVFKTYENFAVRRRASLAKHKSAHNKIPVCLAPKDIPKKSPLRDLLSKENQELSKIECPYLSNCKKKKQDRSKLFKKSPRNRKFREFMDHIRENQDSKNEGPKVSYTIIR